MGQVVDRPGWDCLWGPGKGGSVLWHPGPAHPSLPDQVLIWCCSQEAGPRAWILSGASELALGEQHTVARPRASGIQFTRPQALNHLHVGLMSVCRSPTFQPHPLPGKGRREGCAVTLHV